MNETRLFRASCVALIVTAMSFALRGAASAEWIEQFRLSNEQVGWVNGTAFWGFTLAMMFGGPLVDSLGFRRIVRVAFVGHLAGILITIFAWDFWSLFTGTLLFGIANGSVEAACNPLVATLYPTNQTTRLNNLHVWFPGGIVLGGLLAFVFGKLGFGWKAQFATMLVPLGGYGFAFARQKFPQTEVFGVRSSIAARLNTFKRPVWVATRRRAAAIFSPRSARSQRDREAARHATVSVTVPFC